jgi:hypothetical protein
MSQQHPESESFEEAEARARALHSELAPDAELIFLDGFNLLLRGLDALKGHNIGASQEHRVMTALVVQGLNSMRCAFDLAMRGYYVQALNLARPAVEDWMAYWFLRNYPREYQRFIATGREPPDFNDMLQKIESRQNRARKAAGIPENPPEQWARGWMKGFHQFSHVSRVRVSSVMEADGDFTTFSIGPNPSEAWFRAIVSHMIPILLAYLDALSNLRQLAGKDALEWKDYSQRVNDWRGAQQSLVEELLKQR